MSPIRRLHAEILALRFIVGQLVGRAVLTEAAPRDALALMLDRIAATVDAMELDGESKRDAEFAGLIRSRIDALFAQISRSLPEKKR